MELLKKRLANLLCIKSIMTLVLTGVFAYMAVNNTVTQEFTGITSESDPRYTATYYPLNKVTYRVYQSDPSHTYDANDQVLSVNGNENVTRDLKVQGYIFQDANHIAFLPEIKSNVIEVGDLD